MKTLKNNSVTGKSVYKLVHKLSAKFNISLIEVPVSVLKNT